MSHLSVRSPSNEDHCSLHHLWHFVPCMQSCLIGSSCFSSNPGQKNILLFRLFLSWARWLSNSRPILEILFWPVGSSALILLVMFKSEFLNGESVIICDRLTDLPLLMADFYFGRGKMFDGEILAFSAFAILPSGGEMFLRVFEYVLPSAAFFSIDTGICNSLLVSPGGPFFKFLWGRLITSDERKSSSKK